MSSRYFIRAEDVPAYHPANHTGTVNTPMNDLDALIDDPHLASVKFFETKSHPTEGQIHYTGIPSRWNGSALKISRHAPHLGEHSLSVFRDAGISADEIDTLLAGGTTIDGEVRTKTDTSVG